jgi:DNA-binding transcriptional regulator YhcF (GntR family)
MSADQLAATLRREIRGYLPGTRLPGRNDLAEHFGVTPHTARRALGLMAGANIAPPPDRPTGFQRGPVAAGSVRTGAAKSKHTKSATTDLIADTSRIGRRITGHSGASSGQFLGALRQLL